MGKSGAVRGAAGEPDSASLVDQDLLNTAVHALKTSGSFRIPGFGTFSITQTKGRGTVASIGPNRTVRFRPSRTLTDAVLEPAQRDEAAEALEAAFQLAVRTAVGRAHAAGLAAPGRENAVAVESRPDGRQVAIDEDSAWSPESWKAVR